MIATNKETNTLIERTFGRGTDFICDDLEINKEGGMIAI